MSPVPRLESGQVAGVLLEEQSGMQVSLRSGSATRHRECSWSPVLHDTLVLLVRIRDRARVVMNGVRQAGAFVAEEDARIETDGVALRFQPQAALHVIVAPELLCSFCHLPVRGERGVVLTSRKNEGVEPGQVLCIPCGEAFSR